MNYRYSIVIQWSDEDNAFLVHLVESYQEEGRALPIPRSSPVDLQAA
jgi:hypothetical protein